MSTLRAIGLVLISVTFLISRAHATLISHNGYTLNTNTNIISDGRGSEWLQWTVTQNMSVNDALEIYQTEGWNIASGEQVADLFNQFKFNYPYVWIADENAEQYFNSTLENEEALSTSPSVLFVELFGETRPNGNMAFYGLDEDNDGYINVAYAGWGTNWLGDIQYSGGMDYDGFENTTDDAWGYYGVALVRSSTFVEVSSPSSLLLIFVALLIPMLRSFRFRLK